MSELQSICVGLLEGEVNIDLANLYKVLRRVPKNVERVRIQANDNNSPIVVTPEGTNLKFVTMPILMGSTSE